MRRWGKKGTTECELTDVRGSAGKSAESSG